MGNEKMQQFLAHMSWSLNADLKQEIDFAAISAETLILNGGKDPVIDAKSMRILDKIMPRCKRMVVPNAGHFIHLECHSLLKLYQDFFNSKLNKNIECYIDQPH